MDSLQRALIEKVGNDNGFEHTAASDAISVTLASARHPTRARVYSVGTAFRSIFESAAAGLIQELRRNFPQGMSENSENLAEGEAGLAELLRRAASLSCVLPSQLATNYQKAVAEELAILPASIAGTEVERLVRQRVGQDKFRDAMLDYWGGACAVTGVAMPEVLRASHAKPWAECGSDTERLDVFNGFLLAANLDALFDRFLISFDEQGVLIIAPGLATSDLEKLGILSSMRLRWLTSYHKPYLNYHRGRLLALL